jgi:RES domain-containing protein
VEYPRELLEALSRLPSERWSGRTYRCVFEGTPPQRANSRGARWNPPGVEALYTGLSREVVIAEIDNLIAAQGIAPNRRRVIYTLDMSLRSVLILDVAALKRIGINDSALRSDDHAKCSLIGGAVHRLQHDGLLIPSVRGDANNLVVFVGNRPFGDSFQIVDEEVI